MKSKLQVMHGDEVEELKLNHQKYIECLQGEIEKLEGFIKNKNEEI